MKHKLLIAVSSSILMAVPNLATAHDDEGWYLRGNLGYGIHTVSYTHLTLPTILLV